ncbi:NUDIX domain-containing protein [Paenibacillus lycopersici]|uniref:NUDIX domain-containing protein n=1 Tax=Paenibacillus lycopersici TaxID=2704462 RepID=A0A6C0G099_9BACL|nr:NUDIX domain-containing protein [Paenibacillus lycopersici]QHT62838.1 NUDIX domain-containing protein [Paenibacillus lycopersici]
MMISVRTMTGAFLLNHDDVLMMKRSNSKKIAPGLWSCVGGHVEPHEHGSPESSCLREIAEETGILQNEIKSLHLRYILLRQKEDELNQHYIFFGDSSTRNVINCDEGDLHWVQASKISNLQMSLSLSLMWEHYQQNPNSGNIWTGTYSDGKMIWGRLLK